MAFGTGGGQITEEGENILAEWDWDFGGMGDAFNALLGRYGDILDIGIENMRRQQQQDPVAFDLWRRGKESGLETEDLARRMGKREYHDARSAMFAANKARQREDIRRRNLMETPPPTRMVTGPGVVPGRVMDPMAMSAEQRAVFLPQNAPGGPVGDVPSTLDWRSGMSPMDAQYTSGPAQMWAALRGRG